jgi:hypothetical protein
MNLVGKIFIVLIFVMSILFMGFTVAVYATHTNWRNLVMDEGGLNSQLDNAKKELERVQGQLTTTQEAVAAEKTGLQIRLSQAETAKSLLTKERDQQTQIITQLTDDLREATAAMENTHKTLAGMRQEVATLRARVSTAEGETEAALRNLIAATDDANIKAQQMLTLQKQMVEGLAQLDELKEVTRIHNLNPDPAAHVGTPTKGVPGLVSAVRPGGIVEITLGSDDGLRQGHRLDVYRTGGGVSMYLGKIEVMKTDPDVAACKVLPEFRKGNIQANDRVSTGLQSQ